MKILRLGFFETEPLAFSERSASLKRLQGKINTKLIQTETPYRGLSKYLINTSDQLLPPACFNLNLVRYAIHCFVFD